MSNYQSYDTWDSKSTIPSNSYGGDNVKQEPPKGRPDALTKKQADGDSFMENFLEFFDPTGVLSYDDADRAYKAYKKGETSEANLILETAGALPLIGKIKKLSVLGMSNNPNVRKLDKLGKALNVYGGGKVPLTAVNRGDAVQDMYEDNFSTKKSEPKPKPKPKRKGVRIKKRRTG